METIVYILWALLGTLLGGLLSSFPGMHVLNFMGIGLFIFLILPIDPLTLTMISLGMLVGYIVIGIVQMTYMGVPDDSTRYFAFPNQKYVMYGRGHEAAMLAGIGALGGALILLVLSPLSSLIFPAFRKLTTPHFHWVLIGVVAYLLQADWPKDWGSRAKTRLGRLKDGWASLSASWFVFFLSMMLGFICLNISIFSPERAFQNLMPVVVGFFGTTFLLINATTRARIPPQSTSNDVYVSKTDMARGVSTGFMGGMFAAYQPMITAGPGLKLAGHATSTSGDLQFMISGGAGRYAYYIGAFFLFWIPLLHLTRGGAAWIMSVMYSPALVSEFWLLMASVGIATAFAFALLWVISKALARVISRFNFQNLSMIILALVVSVVWSFSATLGYNPATVLGTIIITAVILYLIFRTFAGLITHALAREGYLIYLLGLVALFVGFILVEASVLGFGDFALGFGQLAEGARAMVILATATGIGLVAQTFRCMWTYSLIGYFFPIMLNMAGLSAGILVALGVY
jgi:putative membrane protein